MVEKEKSIRPFGQGLMFPDPTNEDDAEFQKVCVENYNLFHRKGLDYGDTWRKRGLIGMITEIARKVDRLLNLSERGFTATVNEPVEDSLQDLCNYSMMGIISYRVAKRR